MGIGFRRRDKVPSQVLISAAGAHIEATALLRRRGQGGAAADGEILRSSLRRRCGWRGVMSWAAKYGSHPLSMLGQKGGDYQRIFKMPAKQRFDR